MNTQQPQSCTKCGNLPEDILMLACNHDLCLNCASDRLAFELQKNRNANVIVCSQCYQKTPLDPESIEVLKSMIKPTTQTSINQPLSPTPQKHSNPALASTYRNTSSIGIDRGLDRSAVNANTTSNKAIAQSKLSNNQSFSGISSRKNCLEHQDEQILYFCFDCRCECICPQCIIHGKHKDHDVKTVRKSQPIVKSTLQSYIRQLQQNTQQLHLQKSQLQKHIRTLTQKSTSQKSQLKQAFQDMHKKLQQKQKQLLSNCDQSLQQNISMLQKSMLTINTKSTQFKQFINVMYQSNKQDQISLLNFYARKWREIQGCVRDREVEVGEFGELWKVEGVIGQILDIGDQVVRVGGRGGRLYRQN